MWEDPIVAEVRRVRTAHAAQFNNDLLAIYRDLKAQEQKSGSPVCVLSSSPCRPIKKTGQGSARRLTPLPPDICASEIVSLARLAGAAAA